MAEIRTELGTNIISWSVRCEVYGLDKTVTVLFPLSDGDREGIIKAGEYGYCEGCRRTCGACTVVELLERIQPQDANKPIAIIRPGSPSLDFYPEMQI